MNKNQKNLDLNIQEATNKEIAALVTHHCKMFCEIWDNNGESLTQETLYEIEKSYAEKLEEQLGDGTCSAWIIKNENIIIASGAITICNYVPTPMDHSGKIAFFHSLYTEKRYRNNNCANLIIEKAINHCKSKGIKRVFLSASNAGKSIYQKVGFNPDSDLMQLFIEED